MAVSATELERLTVRLVGDGSHYKKTLNAAIRNTEVAAKKIKRVGNKMKSIGTAATVGLTVPVAGMIAAFATFDDKMTKSTSIMSGVTKELRKEMEDMAKSISRNSITSIDALAESYYFLASAGLSAKQSIAALVTVEKFAVAGAFDMATATSLLTGAQNALGLSSKDSIKNMEGMIKVSDTLVMAAKTADASVQQFSEALTREAGATIKQYNMDMSEGVAILSKYASEQLTGASAGSMFARMVRFTTRALADNKEMFEELEIDVGDFGKTGKNITKVIKGISGALEGLGPEAKLTRLQMLGFEMDAQQAIMPLLGASKEIYAFKDALEDVGGTTKQVAEKQLSSFSAQMKMLWNNVRIAAIEIGETLAPFILKLNGYLRTGIDMWNNLSKGVKRIIAYFAGAAAVLGPLLIGMGMLVAFLGSAAAAMIPIVTAMIPIAAAMIPIALIAAKVVLVVGAVAAAVTAVVWALIGTEGMVDAWNKAKAAVISFGKTVIGFIFNIKENMELLIPWIKESWTNGIEYIGRLFTWLKDNWINILKDMGMLFAWYVVNRIHNMKVMLKTFFRLWIAYRSWMALMFKKIFSIDFLNIINTALANAARAVGKWATSVWKKVKGAISGKKVKTDGLVEEFRGAVKKEEPSTDLLATWAKILKESKEQMRSPFEGFKSSAEALPELKHDYSLPEFNLEYSFTKGKEAVNAVADAVADAANAGNAGNAANAARVNAATIAKRNKAMQEAASLTASMLTPQEIYTRELEKTNKLYKDGMISAATYERAVAALNKEINKDKIAERNKAMQEAASLTASMLTSQEKHARELKKINKLHKDGMISTLTYERAITALNKETKMPGTKMPGTKMPGTKIPKAAERDERQTDFSQVALNRISLEGLTGFAKPKKQEVEARGVETRLDTLIAVQKQQTGFELAD